MKNEDQIPALTKIIFGSADLFGGGAMNLIGFYYLIFLTDVLRINPAWAGVIFLVSKGWDAISDPLMGMIVDRTRSKWGKHRPYFLAAVFSIFIAVVVIWTPIPFNSVTVRFIYALFAYLLFSTVSTTVMIPYISMQPTLTSDYKERISLNAFKMAFSFIASILVALLPMMIVDGFVNIRTGYFVMALVFGAFFALPWLILFLHIREPDSRKMPVSRMEFKGFFDPLKVNPFRKLIGIYLGAYLAMDILSALMPYYMTYVQGRSADLKFVLGAIIISEIVSLPVVSALAKKIGKKKTFIISAAIWTVNVAFIAFTPVSWPNYVIYIQAVITGIGIGGSMVMPWTMYPDTADAGKFILGKESAGKFSGMMTFFRKLASAGALFIVGTALDLIGYVKPPEGSTVEHMPQAPEVLTGIKFLLVLAPFLLLLVAVFFALRYNLTHERFGMLRKALDGRLSKKEEDELRKSLA